MSYFFLLNNLHFALEMFGMLVFFMVAWLALDSWLIRRNFVAASRGLGFSLLGIGNAFHALAVEDDYSLYVGASIYTLGLIFAILNLIMETPVPRPSFDTFGGAKAPLSMASTEISRKSNPDQSRRVDITDQKKAYGGILIPAFSAVLFGWVILQTIGHLVIFLLSFRQYKKELKKALIAFWAGFLVLAASSAASILGSSDVYSLLWILEHLLRMAGFILIALWVWQYIQARLREALIILLTGFSLIMAVVISLVFFTVTAGKIEDAVRSNLVLSARVLNYTISRLEERASAEAAVIASNNNFSSALSKNDFEAMSRISGKTLDERNIGFVTVINGLGDVLVRAGSVVGSKENIAGYVAFEKALKGELVTDTGRGGGEAFSVRAYSPVRDPKNGKIIGAVSAGFYIDNALTDSMRLVTGQDLSVLENGERIATTILSSDGRRRITGAKESNPRLAGVLEKGGELTEKTVINSRQALASFAPIKNADGKIVGAVSSSVFQKEVLDTAQSTNRLTFFITLLMMLVFTAPIYLIARKLENG